jgi:lipopolysaccharide transport system permease protein
MQAATEATNDSHVILIEPSRGWVSLKLRELWEYRELLYFIVWRDIKVRYKQTILGIAWALAQPLMTMLVFTAVFGNFAKLPSDGVPYPLFSYSALMVWNYFAKALSTSVTSVAGQAHLISKIYFPRLLLPIGATLSGIVDFAISFLFLIAMMIWFGIVPSLAGLLTLPFFLLLAMMTALSVGFWFSAINVRYRDIGQAIPFLVQVWLFASPVAYPVSLVPEKWRLLYNLNPMTGVIEGVRWALFGKQPLSLPLFSISAVGVVVLLIGGIFFFKRMERTFADVV